MRKNAYFSSFEGNITLTDEEALADDVAYRGHEIDDNNDDELYNHEERTDYHGRLKVGDTSNKDLEVYSDQYCNRSSSFSSSSESPSAALLLTSPKTSSSSVCINNGETPAVWPQSYR